jgi:hypothetical protein
MTTDDLEALFTAWTLAFRVAQIQICGSGF